MEHHRGFYGLRTINIFISAILLVNLVEYAYSKVISKEILMYFLGCIENGGIIGEVFEREKRIRIKIVGKRQDYKGK